MGAPTVLINRKLKQLFVGRSSGCLDWEELQQLFILMPKYGWNPVDIEIDTLNDFCRDGEGEWNDVEDLGFEIINK